MIVGITKERCSPHTIAKMTGSGQRESIQNDLILMDRIASSNKIAFHHLYQEYGQRMFAFALRITGDRALAEDVIQDSLVIVWNSAKTYKGKNRLLTWLLGIVHHTAVKSLRHISSPIDEDIERRFIDNSPTPEEQAQRNERSRVIQDCIQKLSPDHRAVLDLVFYQGMNLGEISEICDCPIGTVKSRLSYARAYLKSMLIGLEDGI